MQHTYPAIVLRRAVDEDETNFQQRKDRCRNAAMAVGFTSPEKFEGNIFDENTLETEVMQRLEDWPCILIHDGGDLANTRNQFAERLNALEAAGVNLIIVEQDIDLRGGTELSQAAIKMNDVWRSLADEDDEEEEEEESGDAAPKGLKYPKGMTEEQHAIVRQHYVTHGVTKPSELKKALGVASSGTAKNWLVWAQRNPLPVAEPTPPADDSAPEGSE